MILIANLMLNLNKLGDFIYHELCGLILRQKNPNT